jgi:hypothetical protein
MVGLKRWWYLTSQYNGRQVALQVFAISVNPDFGISELIDWCSLFPNWKYF